MGDFADRGKQLELLEQDYMSCRKCSVMRSNRESVVFGEGSVAPGSVMLIGEAPGKEEDWSGLPFVGTSGKLLDEILLFVAHSPRLKELQEDYNQGDSVDYPTVRQFLVEDERLFYANTVCCRPDNNRNPTRQELSACWDRLRRTILIVDPVLIITLGKVPMNLLTKTKTAITKVHGQLKDIVIPGEHVDVQYPLYPLVHPSFIEREGGHNEDGSWAQITFAEMLQAMVYVDHTRHHLFGEPIPDRGGNR
jgi:DNA polymerase